MKRDTILFPVSGPERLHERLSVVAAAFDGQAMQLVVLYMPPVGTSPASYAGVGLGLAPLADHGTILSEWRRQIDDIADATRGIVEDFRAPESMIIEWRAEFNDSIQALVRQSFYADVVLLMGSERRNTPSPEYAYDQEVIGGLLDLSPTPILLLPDAAPAQSVFARPMIGWKETPEAGRALRTTVAVTAEGASVDVIHVVRQVSENELEASAPADASTFLARHGLSVNEKIVNRPDDNVGQALILTAVSGGNSVIILGAYSRTRWVERVFGGVTQTLIDDAPVPLLLVH